VQRLARRLLLLRPELHILVVVALLVALAAHLAVEYLARDYQWRMVISALLFLSSGFVYARWVTPENSRLWLEAARRGGMPEDKLVEQLVALKAEEPVIRRVARAACVAVALFVAASLVISRPLYTQLDQAIANGLSAGALYGLFAVGFGLIYSTSHFFDFAYGSTIMVAAYGAYYLSRVVGWAAIAAVVAMLLFTAVAWPLIHVLIYRRLQKRGAGSLVLLLASLGLFVALQSLASLVFSDDARVLRSGEVRSFAIGNASLTSIQLVTICTSIVITLALGLGLRLSRLGVAVRAVANDPTLAKVAGVRTERVVIVVVAVGSVLAAVSGILMGYDTDIVPSLGFRALMLAVASAVVGGVGSIEGGFVGGMLIGMSQQLGVWKLPTQWQDTIVFSILIVFLLLRPQGLVGKPIGKAVV
jgi:branched-chain amino acid transport system permease protein